MGDWRYRKGLTEIGDGLWAYLQPNGGWGWSNAGLVTHGDASLLVDTLFDERLTGEMLAEMRRASPAAASIGQLVNTHANGDHCWGNRLVEGAEIVASAASAAEMSDVPPSVLAGMMASAPQLGHLGEYIRRIFGAFDFAGVDFLAPTRTFDGELALEVGDKRVELIEVGPAHTRGDVVVVLPEDRVVFTGDILFHRTHPILWAGPIENWIAAIDRIVAMDPEVVVPGHGPITDADGLSGLRGYLEYIRQAARERFEAGMSAEDAARDIALDAYADWNDAERIVVNVHTLYNQFRGVQHPELDVVSLFSEMASFAKERGLHGM